MPSGHFLLSLGSSFLPSGSLFGDPAAFICSLWTWLHSDYLVSDRKYPQFVPRQAEHFAARDLSEEMSGWDLNFLPNQ